MLLFVKYFTLKIMIVQSLNLYSLLVPTFMFIMGSCVLLFQFQQPIPKYLQFLAYAQILIAFSILCISLLSGQVLLESSAYLYGLFFLGCSLHLYAIHLCLSVKMLLSPLMVIIPSALCALLYFSVFDDQAHIRILIVGLTTAFIYAHQYFMVYKKYFRHRLERIVKVLLPCLVLLALLHCSWFYVMYAQLGPISQHTLFWVMTQLLLFLISSLFLTLFIAYSIQNSFLHLRQERNLDPLTGLNNRRAFNEQLASIRFQPVSQNALMMCDVDFFKKINDQHGHLVGDSALKHVSRIMLDSIRQQDQISRFGGEEFTIILHDTQTSIALQIAERIRRNIEQNPLPIAGQSINMTVSIGISFFHFYSEIEEAIQHADQLLYQAKRSGRNQVKYEQCLD